MEAAVRAQMHAALGDERRLAVVDALRVSDLTPSELRERTGLSSNLLAFHLDVLETAGLVRRQPSSGDGRRRYVRLRSGVLQELVPRQAMTLDGTVLFVCTRNAARSQMAAALWRDRTGGEAQSAGMAPADQVDEWAVAIAAAHGLALGNEPPQPYSAVTIEPAVVISVCDRAREDGLPWTAPRRHWSIADPDGGDAQDYERAFQQIARRINDATATTMS